MTRERLSDDEVRRLIEAAGPRTEVPTEHHEAIIDAARSAWRRKVVEAVSADAEAPAAQSSPAAPLASLDAARAARAARAEGAEAVRSTRPGRRRWAAAAAIALLALAAAWWLGGGVGSGAPAGRLATVAGEVTIAVDDEPRAVVPGSVLYAGTALTTGVDARAALVLDGGTEVRLDADTRVRLVSASTLELDRGAVYADTGADGAADETRLAIATPLGTARDIGTRFTVRLLERPRPLLAVRVRDGVVEVEQAGAGHRASAGEAMLLDAAGAVERRPVATHGDGWEWVLVAAAGFEVEGKSLAELLAWVERETGWRVRYASAELEAAADDIVLHGDIGDLPPDEALFAVLPGAGLDGRVEDGVLTVERAR